MSIWLSLLLFNPLESVVLFWAAIGDSKEVFKKKNIKHFYILGTINFIFQYFTQEVINPSISTLFLEHFYGLFISGIFLYKYLNVLNYNIKIQNALIASIFNSLTILLIVILFSNFFINIFINLNILQEIIVNTMVKIIQFLSLYIFFRRNK